MIWICIQNTPDPIDGINNFVWIRIKAKVVRLFPKAQVYIEPKSQLVLTGSTLGMDLLFLWNNRIYNLIE